MGGSQTLAWWVKRPKSVYREVGQECADKASDALRAGLGALSTVFRGDDRPYERAQEELSRNLAQTL